MTIISAKYFAYILILLVFVGTNLFYLNSESIDTQSPVSVLAQSDTIINSQNSENSGHGDKYTQIYLFLFFIITGVVIGRFIARKIFQPAVLGELLVGVAIGIVLSQFNSPIMTLIHNQSEVNKIIKSNVSENLTWGESIKKNLENESFNSAEQQGLIEVLRSPEFPDLNLAVQSIFLFSNLGVLLLLFLVGLETSVEEMLGVGLPAMVVAILGIIVPSVLGYIATMLLLPDHGFKLYLFVGATLSATSIGITARVFKDLDRLNIPEAKIVLGAAVIDDILGLIVLAVVAGIIATGTFQITTIMVIFLKAALFLGITLYLGTKFLKRPIKLISQIENKNISVLFPFALLLILAWLSDQIGLASIVGAFAAGLIIKEEYFNNLNSQKNKTVKSVMEPIETILAPVFFVIMGLQVDLSAFLNYNILGLALLLTLVGIIGKLLSGIFSKGMDKKIIGIGMVPRGEVGLIFAGIGKGIGILDSALFSAIIIVVILTTFITPPALKWAFTKYHTQ